MRRWWVAGAVALGLALVVTGYLLGLAWWPAGTAPSSVLQGRSCPSQGDAEVRPPDADVDSWRLVDTDPPAGGYREERSLKSQLPWLVRFRLEWDSEGSLMAAYGSRADVCMAARVLAHDR